jgi:hypothetical protein
MLSDNNYFEMEPEKAEIKRLIEVTGAKPPGSLKRELIS